MIYLNVRNTNMARVYITILRSFLFFLFISSVFTVEAQNACPVNIGFEQGNFSGWNCLDGKVDTKGVISMALSGPITGKHTLYKNTLPQARDTFGGFPVNCPNGSGYSMKLGNSGAGAEAQSVMYTFTVPAGQNDYSIIYNYAVVLQNPAGHAPYEQPQFTSKVFDVTANKYLECGSFQFIAAPNLPGFKESTVEPNIFYKEWAPVTIKLTGYAGKTIRLEFTVNDCTKAVHFGYAYLDVDENCTTPITGNTYCNGTGAVVLRAPYGFKDYNWYDDQSQLVGTGNLLTLNPPPPGNSNFTLEIIPYPGQGCQDTLRTKIIAASDQMKLVTPDSLTGCPLPGIDISAPSVTAGSTAGLSFNYYANLSLTEFVDVPTAISKSGTYYIRATGPSGCTETRPVVINVRKSPILVIHDPSPVCIPGKIDLTNTAVVTGSETGLSYSYWQDTLATQALSNPSAVSKSGKYFIKAIGQGACYSILPVQASITTAPAIVIHDISSCGSLPLSAANPTAGSDASVKFTYWADAATTTALAADRLFLVDSVFYIRSTAVSGCSLITPVKVSIHPFPVFTVNNPPPTTRPATVDLTTTVPFHIAWNYSYWLDEKASKAIVLPKEVSLSGTYYIKALDTASCVTINPVTVIIIDPPIIAPNAFSPNNDGINDTWQIPLLSFYPDCTVDIFNRTGQTVFRSAGYAKPWDGNYNGNPLPVDTYYYIIKLSASKAPVSGSVTLVR